MAMQTDLNDFRDIQLLVDQNNNIAIFPTSRSKEPIDDEGKYAYYVAYHPIELFSPYSLEELAGKIQEGFESWNVYPMYDNFSGKNTFEEKYYGIKGFKNAVFGKRYVNLGWNDLMGKRASIAWPLKRGYGYLGMESRGLADDADYLDFAKVVIELISLDLTTLRAYKANKRLLLL